MSKWTERALEIPCDGEICLGVIHRPVDLATNTGVLVIVGGPQYRVGSHRQFVTMARQMASRGIPVMRFDVRGMGDSTGNIGGFEHIALDIRCAIDAWQVSDAKITNIALWGLCDAASAAMMYVAEDKRVVGMVAANPWVRSESSEARSYVRHYYGARLLNRAFWGKLLTGRVRVASSLADFSKKLLRSLSAPPAVTNQVRDFRSRMTDGMLRFRGSTLLLMSGRDLTAREFDELSASSPEWRKLFAEGRLRRLDMPDADHTFSDRGELDRVSAACCDWLFDVSRETAQ